MVWGRNDPDSIKPASSTYLHFSTLLAKRMTVRPIAQMVERLLREREVVGSNPGCAIPKALKMVPVATLLGAQHYIIRQTLALLSLTTNTANIAQKLKKTQKTNTSTWFLGTCLMSPSGVKTYRKIDR